MRKLTRSVKRRTASPEVVGRRRNPARRRRFAADGTAEFGVFVASQHARVGEDGEGSTVELQGHSLELGEVGNGGMRRPAHLGLGCRGATPG